MRLEEVEALRKLSELASQDGKIRSMRFHLDGQELIIVVQPPLSPKRLSASELQKKINQNRFGTDW